MGAYTLSEMATALQEHVAAGLGQDCLHIAIIVWTANDLTRGRHNNKSGRKSCRPWEERWATDAANFSHLLEAYDGSVVLDPGNSEL